MLRRKTLGLDTKMFENRIGLAVKLDESLVKNLTVIRNILKSLLSDLDLL